MSPALMKERWKNTWLRWRPLLSNEGASLDLLPVRHFQQEGLLEDEINLYREEDRYLMDSVIENTDVIIFDNFDKVTTHISDEDNFRIDEKSWGQLFLWLRGWMDRGKTFIIIAHSNKSGVLHAILNLKKSNCCL